MKPHFKFVHGNKGEWVVNSWIWVDGNKGFCSESLIILWKCYVRCQLPTTRAGQILPMANFKSFYDIAPYP